MKGDKLYNIAVRVACLALLLGALSIVLEEETKSDIKSDVVSRIMQPLMYLGFKFGILPGAIFKKYDDSPFEYPRMIMSKEYFDLIQNTKAQPGDVFIATYPKSGTHFSAQLTTQVMNEGKAEFDSLHEYVVGVEFEMLDIENAKEKCGHEVLSMRNFRDSNKVGPLMTHLAKDHLPYHKDAKYIVLMRNPVDVLASGRKMVSKILGERLTPSMEDFYKFFFGFHYSWQEYNLHWWKLKNEPNVLFMFYEDALQNLTNTVIQVTEFLGKPVDPDTIERVRYLSSFEYMKPNAKKFEVPSCTSIMKTANKGKESVMVNKGKAGKGKAAVPKELREKIKALYHKTFDNTDFPIERYADSIL